jgi:hypothetical protein
LGADRDAVRATAHVAAAVVVVGMYAVRNAARVMRVEQDNSSEDLESEGAERREVPAGREVENRGPVCGGGDVAAALADVISSFEARWMRRLYPDKMAGVRGVSDGEKSIKFKRRHALQNDKVGLAIAIAWKVWYMDIDEAFQWVQRAILST